MHYLSTMSDTQTLVLYSGHPLGLFPSHRDAPRVIITNGMVILYYNHNRTDLICVNVMLYFLHYKYALLILVHVF